MKQARNYVVSTFVSGLLVVVPVYLAALLLLKAMHSVMGLVRPFVMLLPESLPAEGLLSLLLVLLICFFIGVAVRTRPGARPATGSRDRFSRDFPAMDSSGLSPT
jgi:hypothetical protein